MLKHQKLTLQEKFEYPGYWWLPENADEEICGTLSYSPTDGIHLALLGTFDSSFPPRNRSETEIVNGVTANGIPCTLFGNIQVGYSLNSPGFPQQKLSSNLLVMGDHLSSFDELVFSKWKISFEYLDDWISPNLFDETHTTEDGISVVTIVARPEDHYDDYVKAIDGRIGLTTNMFSGAGDTSGQVDLSKEAFFVLTPNLNQSYEKFNRWRLDIQNLLSLLMVDSIQPRKIHGILSDAEEDNLTARLGLSIFPRFRYRPVSRNTRWYEMLMTFDDLQDYLAAAFERWFEAGHNVRQAVYLFFADTNPKAIDVDTQFVNIMHALESYHRSSSDGQYLSEEDYQQFLEIIVEAIPEGIGPDHRKSLESKLGFGYQYSQRKRFRELFDLISADLQQLVTDGDKVFIGKVVDTRNYLVHRDESSKGLTLEWPERAYAYYRLRILMTILFLQYIGLDDETIYQHVSSNHRLKQFVGSLEEEE